MASKHLTGVVSFAPNKQKKIAPNKQKKTKKNVVQLSRPSTPAREP
jgi:hypothetical protein